MIFSKKPHRAQLIDYSRMQPTSVLGKAIDYQFFLDGLPDNCSLLSFYLRDKKEYFQEHPIMAFLDVFNSLVWLIFAPMLIFHEAVKSFNVLRGVSPNFTLVPFLILLFVQMVNLCAHEPHQLFRKEEDVFDSFVYLYVLYLDLVLACTLLQEFVEDYLLPEQVLLKKMDLFFNFVHPFKENILTEAQKISGIKQLMPSSYAQRANAFFTQEETHMGEANKTSAHTRLNLTARK